MSLLEAYALYDYNSDSPDTLSIVFNEKLYIIDQGNGWSLARNDNGSEGMIPSNYYEILNFPEPISPPIRQNSGSSSGWSSSNEPSIAEVKPAGDHGGSIMVSESSNFGTIRMPKKFLKNGGEDFLLGRKIFSTKMEAELEINKDGSGEIVCWKQLGEDQSCEIKSHRVNSKCKGIITYITYELKSSYSNIPTKRRYNQFDWFHKQLSEKYPCIIIPPLPAKQAIGRFKNDFIEERKIRLQKWLNHITEHPVLSYGNTIKLFLSAPDKSKWRDGKRLIEKDIFKNGRFYNTVEAPINKIDWKLHSKYIEKISTFIENFDKITCDLQESYNRFHKKQSQNICKEYEKIGTSIENLSKSLSLNPCNNKNDIDLLHKFQNIGSAYNKIGNLFKNQAGIDRNLVEINLEEINNVTKEIPSLIELASCAVNTVESVSRKNSESLETIDQSVRVITRTVDAELNWLQNRREQQLRSTMFQYLQNQIQLFTQITEILKESLSYFEN